jgi:hypothetical protein
MRRDGSLLKRYCAGEFDQVWREIRSHVRIEGEFRDEVMEIAEATMRRVAQNADLITERLQAVGWPALSSEYQDLRTPRGGRRPSCGWPIPVWSRFMGSRETDPHCGVPQRRARCHCAGGMFASRKVITNL